MHDAPSVNQACWDWRLRVKERSLSTLHMRHPDIVLDDKGSGGAYRISVSDSGAGPTELKFFPTTWHFIDQFGPLSKARIQKGMDIPPPLLNPEPRRPGSSTHIFCVLDMIQNRLDIFSSDCYPRLQKVCKADHAQKGKISLVQFDSCSSEKPLCQKINCAFRLLVCRTNARTGIGETFSSLLFRCYAFNLPFCVSPYFDTQLFRQSIRARRPRFTRHGGSED